MINALVSLLTTLMNLKQKTKLILLKTNKKQNLNKNYKVWMCGGLLEIAPCSRVGHVFRKSTPYSFPGGTSQIVNHNNARLAEVWLDDWSEFYFMINPGFFKLINKHKKKNVVFAWFFFSYFLFCCCFSICFDYYFVKRKYFIIKYGFGFSVQMRATLINVIIFVNFVNFLLQCHYKSLEKVNTVNT